MSEPSPPLWYGHSTRLVGLRRSLARATAFGHRGALCEWGCLSSWIDSAPDDVDIRWMRQLAEAMRSFPWAALRQPDRP